MEEASKVLIRYRQRLGPLAARAQKPGLFARDADCPQGRRHYCSLLAPGPFPMSPVLTLSLLPSSSLVVCDQCLPVVVATRRATTVQWYLYGAQSHGCTIVSLPSTEPRMYNCIFTEHRATDVQLYLYEAKIHKCTIVFLRSVEPQTWSFIFTKRFHVRLLLSCSRIILILTIVGSLHSVLLPLEESVCHWKRSRCQISTIPVACKECPTVGPRSNLHL